MCFFYKSETLLTTNMIPSNDKIILLLGKNFTCQLCKHVRNINTKNLKSDC